MTKCDKCGKEFSIGDWPFCPHEFVGGNFGEEPLCPYVDEHITTLQHEDAQPCGVEITTRGQRRKMMSENNFEYRPRKYQYGMKTKLYFDIRGK